MVMPVNISASGMLGVTTRDSGSSSLTNAATASCSRRGEPPLATITGSTTSRSQPYSLILAAVLLMIALLKSMPVFTASGGKSAPTESSWAATASSVRG
ncbi:hypothetical protein D3C80_1945160 [compost metagenome]